jgi:hypothetical protein
MYLFSLFSLTTQCPVQAAAAAHTALAPEAAAQRLAADLWAVGDVDALYGASIAAAVAADDEDGGEGADDRVRFWYLQLPASLLYCS